MKVKSVIAQVMLTVFTFGLSTGMTSFAADEVDIENKTVVFRDTWSETVDAVSLGAAVNRQFEISFSSIVYSDGSVTIIGSNKTTSDLWERSGELGTVWYDDSLYKDELGFVYNFTDSSNNVSTDTVTVYETSRIGYDFVGHFNGSSPVGKLFEVHIEPKEPFTTKTVVTAFGRNIIVNPDGASDETPDYEALQEKILDLQNQLDTAKNNVGDVNKDGYINASDAALILQFAAYVGAGGSMKLDEWLNAEDKTI